MAGKVHFWFNGWRPNYYAKWELSFMGKE